jgi:class 3 adenylate cyclase
MRRATRTVTVLFTDVCGSTELMGRLGPAAAEELRSRHFADMRGALAVHRGAEIKTLGDGFMAVFESATDAVSCAVTMQRAALRLPDVAIRVGVSAGEASCVEGDYFGAPVVEASRLCDAAEAGQILVADVLRLLTGGGGLHRLERLPLLELKGLAEPVAACSVDWDEQDDVGLRVALVDDSALLRAGIAQVLEAEGMVVVLQASDTEGLHEALPSAAPHVVVLDVRMPPTHTVEGLLAAERIRRDSPETGVLLLSAEVQAGAARRLLDTGTEGVGYLLKERVADVAELTAAIRTVASGGSAIDPEVIARLAA